MTMGARLAAEPAGPAPAPLRLQRCGGRPCRNCDREERPEAEHLGHGLGQTRVYPQPMLELGAPGDRYEREADGIARTIAGTRELGKVPGRPRISRLRQGCTACEAEDRSLPRGVQLQVDRMRGGGQPLAPSVREHFEPRFGYDFGDVRVHTGAVAANAARELSARAFTVGRGVAFGPGQYAPETSAGRRLLAHELTHVVQQGGASEAIQRAGDPAAIPPGLSCTTDLRTGRPTGTDVLFTVGRATITPAHTADLTTFVTAWTAGGGTDDVVVHGYASTEGHQAANWTLSCDRAAAVRAELVRLGIPAVRISVVAHGESTDFSASRDPNQRAVVTTRAGGAFPLITSTLTARDNFAGRSATRFGVGEIIDLGFFSLPPSPAAGFGGLTWHLAAGGGMLVAIPAAGIGVYMAPAAPGPVLLELRVAGGATAGRVISSHPITIVEPSAVNMKEVPGTAPDFSPFWPTRRIPPGVWGAGFQANVFVDPKDVSFQGVVFGEGETTSVVSGSFLAALPRVHLPNTFGPAHGGNATTGTPVSPPRDNISGSRAPASTMLGVPVCGESDFQWKIPWEFSVAGSPRTPFAVANHHMVSTLLCDASIEKGGAGPFVRSI